MKNPSSDIFTLIKSMNKAEKRYFTVRSQRHFPADNQYAKLFQLIENSTEYDETLLLKVFKPKKKPAEFAVLKNHLYTIVLETLHQFEEFADPEQKIVKGIHYCNILLNKGLYNQCIRQIRKYKEKAYLYEKYENVSELLEIEKRWITKTQFGVTTFKQLEELASEQQKCLAKIETSNQFWLKSNTIYKLHYEKKIAPGKPNKELLLLMEEEKFRSYTSATTFKSKLDQLQINALFAFVNRDIEKAYGINGSFIKLIDENKHLKPMFADRYFSAFNNYLIDSLILQKYDALLEGISEMRRFPGLPEFKHIQHLETNVFRLSYLLELNYYTSQEYFSQALPCVKNAESGLKIYRDKLPKPNVITMRYLCAYILFCNRDFKGCLSVLQILFNIREAETISDIYRDSRMLQLICHFEIGDHFLVDSLIISFQRYLLSHKIKFQTYSIIIRFIKQYTQKIQKPKAAELEQKLITIYENAQEKIVFNNLNYLYWIQKVSTVK